MPDDGRIDVVCRGSTTAVVGWAMRLIQLDVLRCVAVLLVLGRHLTPCPRDTNAVVWAATAVWQRGGWAAQRRPLVLFVVQLGLNAAWTPLFFGAHLPALAFGEIVLLWIAIAATLVAFCPVHRLAGWLLVPYLAWVSFAAVLNFTLWQLNP